jgi:hypothetical protein
LERILAEQDVHFVVTVLPKGAQDIDQSQDIPFQPRLSPRVGQPVELLGHGKLHQYLL